ncbi:MAG TPA: hypothetical protein VGP75_05035, partial [Yoonia sp.]|nr:hypothetical protein [Yoonia sp.]
GSMDALFSSRNVEHLYPHEMPVAFGEFHKVLAEDGFAIITCPDLKSVAALVFRGLGWFLKLGALRVAGGVDLNSARTAGSIAAIRT